MFTKMNTLQFILSATIGSLIACSPTKFAESKNPAALCDSNVSKCVVQNQSIDIVQEFKIGSGKVDILFVNDNSASMSKIQAELSSKFAGFIQNLDSKRIDYRIAVTTTDLFAVQKKKLISLSSGRFYITNADTDRVALFNEAIVRRETKACENFIVSMFDFYGTNFQSTSDYAKYYSSICPSSDTRGIYTANLVISENSSSFMRDDANLNVILISNDNIRQGKTIEENDRGTVFSSMMQARYPNKYWDFNSIVVKDESCKAQQILRNAGNQEVRNAYGVAVSGGIGTEYMNLSNSSARDIDNNPRPRGQSLSICESNFSNHFDSMAIQISDESRMVSLKCSPSSSPRVSSVGSSTTNIPFTWRGNKIVFPRGYGGQDISISYNCYTGPT